MATDISMVDLSLTTSTPKLNTIPYKTLVPHVHIITAGLPEQITQIQALEAEARALDDECEELERKIELVRGGCSRSPVTVFSPKIGLSSVRNHPSDDYSQNAFQSASCEEKNRKPNLWRDWTGNLRSATPTFSS